MFVIFDLFRDTVGGRGEGEEGYPLLGQTHQKPAFLDAKEK